MARVESEIKILMMGLVQRRVRDKTDKHLSRAEIAEVAECVFNAIEFPWVWRLAEDDLEHLRRYCVDSAVGHICFHNWRD